jgi:NADPH:quinone reductase-like Zn-dependent oxidoreductase
VNSKNFGVRRNFTNSDAFQDFVKKEAMGMKKMKALVLDKPGPVETLHMAEVEKPEPAAGEVLVRVHAVGLNPVDYKLAAAGWPTWKYPFILGLDTAGTIEEVGPDVRDWQKGDRVYYHGNLSRPGSFAEYALIVSHVLAPVPQEVSFEEAAAIPCAGFSAYQAIFRKLHLQAGQTILVQGGAGGVGGFAIQLAARLGAMITTTALPAAFDHVKKLGAHHVIDYEKENVKKRVQELTGGRGVDAIVDTVSMATATEGLEMIAFGGGIACLPSLPDFSKIKPYAKGLSIHEIALGGAHLSGDRIAQEDLGRIGREMIEMVRTKKIDPMIAEVIPLASVPDGLQRLSRFQISGKLVARVNR